MISRNIVRSLVPAIIMLSLSNEANAQEKSKTEKFEGIPLVEQQQAYAPSELTKQPEYSDGGMKGFYTYVNKHFKVPKVNKDMTARIYLSFVIEKDGSMSNIKILRDPGYGMGNEAVRVLKSMEKKWIPGELNGEKVPASYNLPITINIRSKK